MFISPQAIASGTARKEGGFALVIALSLMAFILLLLLSLTTLVSVESSSAETARASMQARLNARLSLMVAVGELQKYAGKDQITTARAEITSDSTLNHPYWTGVWDASATTESARWIVSGNQGLAVNDANYLTPSSNLSDPSDQTNTVWLVKESVSNPLERIKVQTEAIAASGDASSGRFGFWVADEGVKAKFNIASEENTATDSQTGSPTTLSYQHGINQLNAAFSAQDLEGDTKTSNANSLCDLVLLAEAAGLDKDYFHDLTTQSFGLLTDSQNGGFKKDLSLAFEDDGVYELEFGNLEQDPRRFFIDHLEDPSTGLTGPNWDILRSYYRLHERVVDGSVDILTPGNSLKTSLRTAFNPYAHGTITDTVDGNPTECLDYYQHENVLHPVISRMRLAFNIRTLPSSTEVGKYNILIDMVPGFGLYNPYNVALNDRVYAIYCRFDPTFEIQVGSSVYTRKLSDMRGSSGFDFFGFVLNTKRKTEGDGTNYTAFMPGETRLFMPIVRPEEKELEDQLRVQWLQNTHSGQALYVNLSTKGGLGKFDGDVPVRINKISLGNDVFLDLRHSHDANQPLLWSWNFRSLQRIQALWQSGSGNTAAEFDIPTPARDASTLTDGESVATWEFNMQTTRSAYGLRLGIDSNLRPLVGSPRWDGSEDGDGNTMMAGFEYQDDHGLLDDSETDFEVHTNEDRYNGYWGSTVGTGNADLVYFPIFDVPREPLLSLGALQHANLGRYSSDPSFIIGNSYANPRIPLDSTLNSNFAGITDLDVYDLSYLVNEKLWDSYFFSSIDSNLSGTDLQNEIEAQLYRSKRYLFEDGADEFIEAAKVDRDDYHALASYMRINGPFNVNSTSVNAWKAVLSSMHDLEVPVYDPVSNEGTGIDMDIFFSRLSSPYGGAYKNDDSDTHANFWRGLHELSEDQINDLAVGIVDELKARGRPFGTMADFVNRDLDGPDEAQRSGILQRVIDREINQDTGSELSSEIVQMTEGNNPYEIDDLSGHQATAFPGYLLQGDILQALAPILTTRSDTFVIRAYGDANNPVTNEVVLTAYCEAVVQRLPDPVEGNINDSANRNNPSGDFGRRFEIVKFRWLSADEI